MSMKFRKDGKSREKKENRGNKKFALGIRGQMILYTVIPIIFCLSAVGVSILNQARGVINDLKMIEIDAQTEAAAGHVDAYFAPFFTTAKVMGDIDCVNTLLNQAQTRGASFRFESSPLFNEVLAEMTDAAANQQAGLQSIWFGGVRNSQLVASDGSYSDESFVITDRPWYKMVEAAPKGEVILTGAYEDYTTGSLVVTAAVGVYNGDTLIGIIGMDIMLDTLMADLSSLSIGNTGFLAVYDSDDNIVYHPENSMVLTNAANAGYTSNMYEALSSHHTASAMEYEQSGVSYCGSVFHSESTGWQVLGCMPESEFKSEITHLKLSVNVGFIGCAWILIIILILITNSIAKPVKKLDAAVGRLAEGDLDVEVDVKHKSEIGQLSDNVTRLVDRLKEYIRYIEEISGVLDEVGHGNLAFRLEQEYVGEFAPLKAALEGIQSNLSRTMYRIADSAAQVDSSTGHIASASQELARGASEQASTVEQLSAAVHELSTHSVEESDRAVNLSKGVAVLGDELGQSNVQMQQMLVAMNDIATQSAEIEKIIKTIEDIAFQTNILALNAAVEAARAGAAGKGFAVVADEVRNLAAKSDEAAKNVTSLIRSSLDAVEKGSGLANETAASVGKVAHDVTEVVTAVEQFAARYQEQTASLGQISEGIEQISAVIQTNSATAEESAASGEELSGQAHLMKQLTEQFTMDERFH